MHFQVPQFIETEDKIIGPLSLRQFLYVAVGGGISFGLFFLFELWLWAIFTIVVMSAAAALAFVKINGRSLTFFMLSAFTFFWNPKKYVFEIKRETPQQATPGPASGKTFRKAEPVAQQTSVKTLAQKAKGESSLKDIGQKLATTKTAIPKRELALPPSFADAPQTTKERYEFVRRITGDAEMARRVDYK